jgi:hypothetical protein
MVVITAFFTPTRLLMISATGAMQLVVQLAMVFSSFIGYLLLVAGYWIFLEWRESLGQPSTGVLSILKIGQYSLHSAGIFARIFNSHRV